MTHPALASDRRDPAAAGGRIVWLLFDELSYDQTFDHRFPGLAMPAFDEFKSKSVVFSNLKPAGYYTDRVIPAFFLGKPVDNIRSGLDGEPMVQSGWEPAVASLSMPTPRFFPTPSAWAGPPVWSVGSTPIAAFSQERSTTVSGGWETANPTEPSDQFCLAKCDCPDGEVRRGLEQKPGFAQQIHVQDLAAIMPRPRR